jgi:hypothetical protein
MTPRGGIRAVAGILLFAATAFGRQTDPVIRQLGANVEVRESQKNTPAKPTPRWPDGRVNLGTARGETGLWFPYSGVTERLVNPDNADAATEQLYPNIPKVSEIPFQPWARALYDYRRGNQFEPHTRCKPSGGPRQFITPYGVEFVDVPELKQIFVFDLGGPHTYRTIYLDGRGHPKDLTPSYYGHSIGHWEEDILVVDSRGFNESFWFDRSGLPHTEQLHMIERFTRTDSKTMNYRVTIDDPGAYTQTWSSGFLLGWDPESELFEYVCQDNNIASELMLGSQQHIDRRRSVVP